MHRPLRRQRTRSPHRPQGAQRHSPHEVNNLDAVDNAAEGKADGCRWLAACNLHRCTVPRLASGQTPAQGGALRTSIPRRRVRYLQSSGRSLVCADSAEETTATSGAMSPSKYAKRRTTGKATDERIISTDMPSRTRSPHPSFSRGSRAVLPRPPASQHRGADPPTKTPTTARIARALATFPAPSAWAGTRLGQRSRRHKTVCRIGACGSRVRALCRLRETAALQRPQGSSAATHYTTSQRLVASLSPSPLPSPCANPKRRSNASSPCDAPTMSRAVCATPTLTLRRTAWRAGGWLGRREHVPHNTPNPIRRCLHPGPSDSPDGAKKRRHEREGGHGHRFGTVL